MIRKHLETRAGLERRMEAARQLRSDTVAGAACMVFAWAVEEIRRILVRTALQRPHQT